MDLSQDTPIEMVMDDIIDAVQDNSTIYLQDQAVAKKKHDRGETRFTYTLTIKEGLNNE